MLNRYHIVESLGKGSFGQVVRARDIHSHEEVAIKIIKNKPAFHMQAQIEIKLLEFLREREADTKYCIGEWRGGKRWKCRLRLRLGKAARSR